MNGLTTVELARLHREDLFREAAARRASRASLPKGAPVADRLAGVLQRLRGRELRVRPVTSPHCPAHV